MLLDQPQQARRSDSLDVYKAETNLLRELFSAWTQTNPDRSSLGAVVVDQWDHGTIGKVILEHAAVQLAATEDIVRVLGHNYHADSVFEPEALVPAQREAMDRMFDAGRGVYAVDLSRSIDFIVATEDLHDLLKLQVRKASIEGNVRRAAFALRDTRARLRSAAFIVKHAPARPGTHAYDKFALLKRMHAVIDRLQGAPWGRSSFGDKALAAKYEPLPYRDFYIPSDGANVTESVRDS